MMRGALLGEFTGTFIATTGYAINPARDFGPRLAHALLPIAGKGGSDWAYSWVPIVGPVIDASLAGYVLRLMGG